MYPRTNSHTHSTGYSPTSCEGYGTASRDSYCATCGYDCSAGCRETHTPTSR